MTAIIAIATATGQGGIGIVRISSPTDLSPIFPYLLNRQSLEPRYAHYGAIYGVDSTSDSNLNLSKKIVLDTAINNPKSANKGLTSAI